MYGITDYTYIAAPSRFYCIMCYVETGSLATVLYGRPENDREPFFKRALRLRAHRQRSTLFPKVWILAELGFRFWGIQDPPSKVHHFCGLQVPIALVT